METQVYILTPAHIIRPSLTTTSLPTPLLNSYTKYFRNCWNNLRVSVSTNVVYPNQQNAEPSFMMSPKVEFFTSICRESSLLTGHGTNVCVCLGRNDIQYSKSGITASFFVSCFFQTYLSCCNSCLKLQSYRPIGFNESNQPLIRHSGCETRWDGICSSLLMARNRQISVMSSRVMQLYD